MKKILVFSLGPIFKDHVHGGSQKVLREVAIHLGKKGHKVNIYCVERDDNCTPFSLSKNVWVFPVLNFKQTFPASYKTAPFNLWKINKILYEQIKNHDIFYIHDSDLNFYDLCNQDIPTIISLRDFLYPETLLGAFNFRRDQIIVNSLHTAECLRYSVGNYLPGINKRVVLIENGINLDLFSRKKPEKVLKLLNKRIEENDKIILYPHRPDPLKGINQSLNVLHKLVHEKNLTNIKLLIPRYIDEGVTDDLDQHYKAILKKSKELKIENNIIFHKWVPYELMPEYYSLGTLTLSVGNFIEAFGSNVGLESLACGTPVIMSSVGAQRSTLPKGIIARVAYGDEESIVEISYQILTGKFEFDPEKIREFIKSKFSYEKMLEGYEKVIVNSKISSPLAIKLEEDSQVKTLIIAPWACLTKFGIYSDYEYKYYPISLELLQALQSLGKISFDKITSQDIRQEVIYLLEKGILVEEKLSS
ncbi:glycosyltransferase family 4 protein [Patescibacteria group bacterium]|nr:glycosyltransferase family 4 protein [Patescibacteria group bacterium]